METSGTVAAVRLSAGVSTCCVLSFAAIDVLEPFRNFSGDYMSSLYIVQSTSMSVKTYTFKGSGSLQ